MLEAEFDGLKSLPINRSLLEGVLRKIGFIDSKEDRAVCFATLANIFLDQALFECFDYMELAIKTSHQNVTVQSVVRKCLQKFGSLESQNELTRLLLNIKQNSPSEANLFNEPIVEPETQKNPQKWQTQSAELAARAGINLDSAKMSQVTAADLNFDLDFSGNPSSGEAPGVAIEKFPGHQIPQELDHLERKSAQKSDQESVQKSSKKEEFELSFDLTEPSLAQGDEESKISKSGAKETPDGAFEDANDGVSDSGLAHRTALPRSIEISFANQESDTGFENHGSSRREETRIGVTATPVEIQLEPVAPQKIKEIELDMSFSEVGSNFNNKSREPKFGQDGGGTGAGTGVSAVSGTAVGFASDAPDLVPILHQMGLEKEHLSYSSAFQSTYEGLVVFLLFLYREEKISNIKFVGAAQALRSELRAYSATRAYDRFLEFVLPILERLSN